MLQLVRLPGNVFTCQSLYLPPIDTSTNSTSMKRSSLVLACWVCRKSFNNFPNTPLCYRLPPSPKNRSEVHCVGPRCTAARISSLKSELTVWFLWFGSRGKFYHPQHWSKLAACDGNGLASFTHTHTRTHIQTVGSWCEAHAGARCTMPPQPDLNFNMCEKQRARLCSVGYGGRVRCPCFRTAKSWPPVGTGTFPPHRCRRVDGANGGLLFLTPARVGASLRCTSVLLLCKMRLDACRESMTSTLPSRQIKLLNMAICLLFSLEQIAGCVHNLNLPSVHSSVWADLFSCLTVRSRCAH